MKKLQGKCACGKTAIVQVWDTADSLHDGQTMQIVCPECQNKKHVNALHLAYGVEAVQKYQVQQGSLGIDHLKIDGGGATGDGNFDPNDPKAESKIETKNQKTKLQLIPPSFNAQVAKAMEDGTVKHGGPMNWRGSKISAMDYIGAVKRHVDAFLDGNDFDISGAHNLGHASARCAIIIDAAEQGCLIDDRPINHRIQLKPDPRSNSHAHPESPEDPPDRPSEGDPHA